jgi:hypothetical protein
MRLRAVDSHAHVIDPDRFAYSSDAKTDATDNLKTLALMEAAYAALAR